MSKCGAFAIVAAKQIKHADENFVLALQLTGGVDEQPSPSHAANGRGAGGRGGADADSDADDADVAAGPSANGFLERSRFIPLRLSGDERRLLHLLEAALSVSSYTDKVHAAGFLSIKLYVVKCEVALMSWDDAELMRGCQRQLA